MVRINPYTFLIKSQRLHRCTLEWMRWSELFAFWPRLSFLVNFYMMLMVIGLIQFIACRFCLLGCRFFIPPFLFLFFFFSFFLLSSFCMNALHLEVLLAFLGVYVWVFESTKINAFYFDKSTLRCQTISNMHTENKCYIVDFWQTEKPFRVERSHFSEINTEFKHIFSPTRRNIYSMCISIGK